MRKTVLICAFALLVALAAASQEEGPFSRLAEFQIKPGKVSTQASGRSRRNGGRALWRSVRIFLH
jgi:hypothetical protein